MRDRDEIEEMIREAELKVTLPRVKVLNLLARAHKPHSVEELIKKLGKKSPDRVTIYRILEQFIDADLVKNIDFKEGFLRYEFDRGHRHHVVCKKCGTVEYIMNKKLENMLSSIGALTKFFRGRLEHSLEFFGICKKCRR